MKRDAMGGRVGGAEARRDPTPTVLRNFGLLVGAIFLFIALWPFVVRGDGPRIWAVAIAAPLLLLGAFAPRTLRLPYRFWMGIGAVLGWVNARILLGVVYFLIVTPMGLAMRMLGKDPMRRSFDRESASYRVRREARSPDHMRRQF